MIVGVFLINYLGESTLEKQILPTYSAVTLGSTDTEIILKKTNALLSENKELQNRVNTIYLDSDFATSELAKQINVLQDQMKKVEETKESSITRAAQLEEQVAKLEANIESLQFSSSSGSEVLAAEKAELELQLREIQEQSEKEKKDLKLQLLQKQQEIDSGSTIDSDQLDKILELESLIASLEASSEDKPDLGFNLLEKIASLESQIIELESRNQTGGSIFDELSGFTHEIPTVQQPKIPIITMTEETVSWDFVDSKKNKYQFSKLTDDFIDEIIRLPPSQDTLTITLTGVGPGGAALTQEVRDLSKFVVGSMPTAMNDLYDNVPTDDEFIFEVWWIVSQFNVVSFDMQDTPKKPLDTFAKGEGDNEDLAILMADMIKSSDAGKTWNVDFIYYNSDDPSKITKINHVALVVDNGQNIWLIEPTAKTIDTAFESRDRIRGNISHIK